MKKRPLKTGYRRDSIELLAELAYEALPASNVALSFTQMRRLAAMLIRAADGIQRRSKAAKR